MENLNLRLIKPGNPPTKAKLKSWLGENGYNYWIRISEMIERKYPGIFNPEWLFGGKKHGWSLRYKKNKSFCTLIPEKNQCLLLIVFGANERDKVESIRNNLSGITLNKYDEAKTYHDGKWLLLDIDNEKTIQDVEILFETKRKPRPFASPI